MYIGQQFSPGLLFGSWNSQDWQHSIHGIPFYDANDTAAGVKQSATCPQISLALSKNQDGTYKYQTFYPPRFDVDWSRGRLSITTFLTFNLGAVDKLHDADFNTPAILSGVHDAGITAIAQAAGVYKHTMLWRLDAEMNGWWEGPWSEFDSSGNPLNGNTKGSYVQRWRHIVGIFKRYAPNVFWIFCPNVVAPVGSSFPTRADSLAEYYPGDDLVDFVGVDVYNTSGKQANTFLKLLRGAESGGDSLAALTSVAPTKPWFFPEVGCTPTIPDRGAWLTDMFNTMPQLPQCSGFTFYNVDNYALKDSEWAAVGAALRNNSAWLQGGGFPLPGDGMPFSGYKVINLPGVDAQLTQLQNLNAQVQTLSSQLQTLTTQENQDQASLATLNSMLGQYKQATQQLEKGLTSLQTLGGV